MANHQRAVYILLTGVMAQGATAYLALWQATDTAGTGAKLIAGILTIAGNTVYCTVLPIFGCSNYVPVPVANWTEVVD